MTIAGFRFAAVAAGIKKKGGLDLGLVVADAPAVVAGVFTRNLVKAAPVLIAQERVRTGRARAVIVNSGCANACTGEAGLAATERSTQAIAQAIGVDAKEVLPASTGVIGQLLPAERIEAATSELVANLGSSEEGFAQAICTTDRWTKTARASLGKATLLGVAKGAGMIHPDVGPPHATMLVFLFTDAAVDHATLARVLGRAADVTFNAASVDGDTSTNDTVLAFASGAAQVTPSEGELFTAFKEVCGKLAYEMVADGEGAEHVARIRVTGLAHDADARQVAKTVATSLLVKTALAGCDANWGRLLGAAGRAGVSFDPMVASVRIGDAEIVSRGAATTAEAEARATEFLKQRSYTIELALGSGPGTFEYLTSDLGHAYVDVNASYRS
jgi:glutamate N-acetyltransferase/amino-acid N-acetyltransferase